MIAFLWLKWEGNKNVEKVMWQEKRGREET